VNYYIYVVVVVVVEFVVEIAIVVVVAVADDDDNDEDDYYSLYFDNFNLKKKENFENILNIFCLQFNDFEIIRFIYLIL